MAVVTRPGDGVTGWLRRVPRTWPAPVDALLALALTGLAVTTLLAQAGPATEPMVVLAVLSVVPLAALWLLTLPSPSHVHTA